MITVVAGLLKAALLKLGRAVFGEAAGDIDLTELAREAADAARPRGPKEPSQPLSSREVARQYAQAASAARPETARPPPIPEQPHPSEPELAWTGPVLADEFPATFPVTDVLPGADSPFPETLPPPDLRKADTVRPGARPAPPRPSRPPPPTPAMPRPAMGRADKRLPPRPKAPPRKP